MKPLTHQSTVFANSTCNYTGAAEQCYRAAEDADFDCRDFKKKLYKYIIFVSAKLTYSLSHWKSRKVNLLLGKIYWLNVTLNSVNTMKSSNSWKLLGGGGGGGGDFVIFTEDQLDDFRKR